MTTPRRGNPRVALWAWALYDLANTTFSLNVVSRYLPLVIVEDLGGRDLDVSVAYSGAMVLVALAAPLLGALSDFSGRRIPYLTATTVLYKSLEVPKPNPETSPPAAAA